MSGPAQSQGWGVLWEILCSSNRVTVSVYIVRVFSSIEHQVFFIRTSRCNTFGVWFPCSGLYSPSLGDPKIERKDSLSESFFGSQSVSLKNKEKARQRHLEPAQHPPAHHTTTTRHDRVTTAIYDTNTARHSLACDSAPMATVRYKHTLPARTLDRRWRPLEMYVCRHADVLSTVYCARLFLGSETISSPCRGSHRGSRFLIQLGALQ